MTDIILKLQPAKETQEALKNLSKGEWLRMCAFFNAARFKNPTTEASMKRAVKIKEDKPLKPEFKDSVILFKKLSDIGEDFEINAQGQVLDLAHDIVVYSTQANSTYDRFKDLVDKFSWVDPDDTDAKNELEIVQDKLDELVKLWSSGTKSGRSEKIKTRIKGILDNLIIEASTRAEKAETLYNTLMDPETGVKTRVQAIKEKFKANKDDFTRKFGEESKDVIEFKNEITELEKELKTLRKKENDEVIVLSTSPLYLAIPLFGPFIMAGVDIGVGTDLAITREKIKSKLMKADEIYAKIAEDELFMTQYKLGEGMVGQIVKDIGVIVPLLANLGSGWRTIAADVRSISDMLSVQGSAQVTGEEWDNFIVTLNSSSEMWTLVRNKAEAFQFNSVPKAISSVEEIRAAKAA
jgi:hypothetical protein